MVVVDAEVAALMALMASMRQVELGGAECLLFSGWAGTTDVRWWWQSQVVEDGHECRRLEVEQWINEYQ